jgi:hypothetical protein
LISYGVAVGLVDPADSFILSCLRDAKKAASDAEKFALYEEALLALDTYGETQTTDTNG